MATPEFSRTACTLLLLLFPSCQSNSPRLLSKVDQERSFVEYRDEIGRDVRLPRRPARIVSLAPSITESLYLLGADPFVVGVTNHCKWPEAAKRKPQVGNLLNPNFEVILAAEPDLVIATTAGNDRNAVLKLVDLGLPVFVTAARSVDDIFNTIANIARIVDREDEGRALVSDMKTRLAAVRIKLQGLPRVRAFFMTWFDPLLAPGRNTFETDVLHSVGVESITSEIEEFYPRFSLEQIIAQDPEVILTVEHNAPYVANLRELRGWRSLRAVRQGRVFVIDETIQHPSPRFVQGVEEMVRKLYPERFE